MALIVGGVSIRVLVGHDGRQGDLGISAKEREEEKIRAVEGYQETTRLHCRWPVVAVVF